MEVKEVRERFNLTDGQFFGVNAYKNLWWMLNGEKIGYGDLTQKQIVYIWMKLEEGEEFTGWNEHHGTQWQQTNTPMVRITKSGIKHRGDIVLLEGR